MRVTNLLIAATLLQGGARLTGLDARPGPASVFLDLADLDVVALAGELRQFADQLELTPRQRLVAAISSSVIGEIDRAYRDIKARISRTRTAGASS